MSHQRQCEKGRFEKARACHDDSASRVFNSMHLTGFIIVLIAKCLPRNEIERFKNNKMNLKSTKELLERQSFMLVQRKRLTRKGMLNKMS